MSLEPTTMRSSSAPLAPATVQSIERHILASAAVVLLHLVLLAAGGVASAFAAAHRDVNLLPKEPLLVTLVALLLAHSSLASIWWASARLQWHIKTVIAASFCTMLWALLVGMLGTVGHEPIAAACWAACMATQNAVVGLATVALEIATSPRRVAQRPRFSIRYLLVWTTIVAAFLGGGRWLAQRWGWTLGSMLDWQFARQLAFVGLANAILAIGLVMSVRLPHDWRARTSACVLTVWLASICMPLAMRSVFAGAGGPTLAELVWLWGGEGLFLVAALVPLEAVRAADRADRDAHQSSAATSNGSSSAARSARAQSLDSAAC